MDDTAGKYDGRDEPTIPLRGKSSLQYTDVGGIPFVDSRSGRWLTRLPSLDELDAQGGTVMVGKRRKVEVRW